MTASPPVAAQVDLRRQPVEDVLERVEKALHVRLDRRGFERIGPQGWNGTGVALGSQRPTPERVTEARVRLLDVLADVPAIVLGRRSDVLAWNRAGHAPAQRPNMVRLVFVDSHTREASSVACRAAARNEAGSGPAFSCREVELGR
ncbi:hypothetical protein ACFWG6_30200 [Streptomyces erythrochromogenes]|uniref:MmyB family transcriptional regulator n=1 Tax=Streptomyces erythrochromogenes TaxID=285574 RepID=UPI003640752A